LDPNDSSKLTYNFKGGLPLSCKAVYISSSLKYRINEKDYDVEDYKSLGIILGGKSDGSQTFVTAAPDIPEIILRDLQVLIVLHLLKREYILYYRKFFGNC
jgi:hypothetical protein